MSRRRGRPRTPAADRPARAVGRRPEQLPDEQAPEAGGGVFRRLGAGTKGSAGMIGLVEQFFAPNAYDAKRDLEEQERVGKPAPAPTDPPELRPEPGSDPGQRFRGTIRLRRP